MFFYSWHLLTLSPCCKSGSSLTLMPGGFWAVVSHFIGPNGVCFSVCLLDEQHNAFVQRKAFHIISSWAKLTCLLPWRTQRAASLHIHGNFCSGFWDLVVLSSPLSGCSLSISAPWVRAGLGSYYCLLCTRVWLHKMSSPGSILHLCIFLQNQALGCGSLSLGFTRVCFPIIGWQWWLALSSSWGSEAILAIFIGLKVT